MTNTTNEPGVGLPLNPLELQGVIYWPNRQSDYRTLGSRVRCGYFSAADKYTALKWMAQVEFYRSVGAL